jgi:predicted cupin superfamily sugar epimerase
MATAKQIIKMLGLKPHPTFGFVAETYRSKQLMADYPGLRDEIDKLNNRCCRT